LGEFGIEQHALRLAARDAHRPRVEEYAGHLAVSLSYLPVDTGPGLRVVMLHIFVGPTWVISLGELRADLHAELADRVQDTVFEQDRGPGGVLYVLAEWAVESYLPGLDELDERIDRLEDVIVAGGGQETVEELFQFKRDLVEVRRTVAPLREVMLRLATHRASFVEPEAQPYFRDVLEEVFRLLESLDTYRDILTSALDLYLSTVSNRLNQVMKRLTVVATLFLPITFITGLFGTNFRHMPYGSRLWFWFMVASLVAVMGGMALYFYRQRWW
jgi:magnesium transporter